MKKKIIDEKRVRDEGEFFTPKSVVDLTHQYIENALGVNWREDYVVFDPACGHCNLTRDYKFKELYCSTLNGYDVKHNLECNYNPEATHFQFDFLNDSEDKLPKGLLEAIQNGDKKLLVIMNPPYGASGGGGASTPHKVGITQTEIRKSMIKNKWGGSDNLLNQFLYNVYRLTISKNTGSMVMCPIVKLGFLTSEHFKNFRMNLFSRFSIMTGFAFGSGHFSGTVPTWGAVTLIMPNIQRELPDEWILPVLDENLKQIGTKNFYNLDKNGVPLNKWLRKNSVASKPNTPRLSCSHNIIDKEAK